MAKLRAAVKELKKMFLGALLLLVVAQIVGSLVAWLRWPTRPTDVTTVPKYNFRSFAGTLWKTKVKMAIGEMKSHRAQRFLVLLPPCAFDQTDPHYRSPSELERVITELPIGTRLQIERLMDAYLERGGVHVTVSIPDEIGFTQEPGRLIYLPSSLLFENRYIGREWTSSIWSLDKSMFEQVK